MPQELLFNHVVVSSPPPHPYPRPRKPPIFAYEYKNTGIYVPIMLCSCIYSNIWTF